MGALVMFLFLAIMASTTQSRWVPTQTHLLMPHWGAAGLHTSSVCDSWRFAVETNNVRDWDVVPKTCADYVGKYMTSDQYGSDCNAVVDEAINYVNSLKIDEIKDIWVFDIDETALSNLLYYKRDDVAFGAKKHNRNTFYEWVESAKAPALDAALKLYKHLRTKNVKIVFLTGVSDEYRTARKKNLKDAGYDTCEKLILKTQDDKDLHGADFKTAKRKELEGDKYNYNIIGNIGDQWSDINGTNVGKRTFKLPNPMYYI